MNRAIFFSSSCCCFVGSVSVCHNHREEFWNPAVFRSCPSWEEILVVLSVLVVASFGFDSGRLDCFSPLKVKLNKTLFTLSSLTVNIVLRVPAGRFHPSNRHGFVVVNHLVNPSQPKKAICSSFDRGSYTTNWGTGAGIEPGTLRVKVEQHNHSATWKNFFSYSCPRPVLKFQRK